MKLKFTATPALPEYHGAYGQGQLIDFVKTGQVKEVPEEQGKELLRAFPKNFDLVKAAGKKTGK